MAMGVLQKKGERGRVLFFGKEIRRGWLTDIFCKISLRTKSGKGEGRSLYVVLALISKKKSGGMEKKNKETAF